MCRVNSIISCWIKREFYCENNYINDNWIKICCNFIRINCYNCNYKNSSIDNFIKEI